MKRTWTQKQLELLVCKYPVASIAELRLYFLDKTDIAIRSKAKVLRLKKESWYRNFTDKEIEEIKIKFSLTHTAELAKQFNCKQSSINNLAYGLGLKKDKSLLAENGQNLKISGFAHRYIKGHIPQNQGRKQTEYMTDEAIERTKATRFAPGAKPSNHKPVGSERTTKDGYREVKMAEGLRCWRLKHRVIWEKANGAIPKSCNIQFKDRDRTNCTLDNLYIINKNQQIKNNTIHRYPKELKRVMRLNNKLKKNIKKQKENEENNVR